MEANAGKPGRAEWLVAGLILVPGLMVAGLAGTEALLARGLQRHAAERRAQLAATEGIAHELQELDERKASLGAAIEVIKALRNTDVPTPEWERVLQSVPPEATTGRVRFCNADGQVTIHGRRDDEALFSELAGKLASDAAFRSAQLAGQGTDDVTLTLVPTPVPRQAEETEP